MNHYIIVFRCGEHRLVRTFCMTPRDFARTIDNLRADNADIETYYPTTVAGECHMYC